nr:putative disease resistance protein RGA4 [Coffea arabica]
MKLKNLHVLNLSGAKNQNLPISIGKLRHLRYINFEDSTSETLPESVCKLYNLQTLRLNSHFLKVLPKGMRDLISLRHLHLYIMDKAFQMPLEMGRLTCLQTLEFFNVGREKGRRIGELGSLKNLKGSLTIRNLELAKDKEEAEEAKLSEKANLFRLQLEWAYNREGDNYNDKDVLDGLRPHSNLEELELRVFACDNLISFPLDLRQTPSLLELGLYWCPKLKTSMTPRGFDDHENSSIYNEFDWSGLISSSSSSSSALRELDLYGLPYMESLPPQIQYLTTMTSLTLYQFGGIKALPDWFGNFAALEDLHLWFFKELGHLPSEDAMRSLTKLKRLEVYGSPLLKERCTPESSGADSQWSKVSHIQHLDITD